MYAKCYSTKLIISVALLLRTTSIFIFSGQFDATVVSAQAGGTFYVDDLDNSDCTPASPGTGTLADPFSFAWKRVTF